MREAWQRTTLGAVAKRLVNGGTPPTDIEAFWNGTIPWITGADFTARGVGEFRRFVSEAAVRQTSTNVIQRGQLLIVTRTGVGKLALAPCNVAISQDITGLYVDETKVDPRFLFHRMRAGVQDLKKLNQGTSINGIIRSDLTAYPLDLPPLPMQRRIAQILSELDELIENTEMLIAKRKSIFDGISRDILSRGVSSNGGLRDTFQDAPGLYEQGCLGPVPKYWRACRLRDLARPGRPHLRTGPFGSSLKIEHWKEEGHPVITIGSLGEGRIDSEHLLFVSATTAQRLFEFQLEVGDVVFSRVADVGRSVVIQDDQHRWIMSSNLMRISVDRAKMLPDFLQALLAHDGRIRAQIRAKVNAGGRDVANSAILNELRFPVPSLEEQRAIVERLRAHTKQQEADLKALDALRALRRGLSSDLLSGRRRVSA